MTAPDGPGTGCCCRRCGAMAGSQGGRCCPGFGNEPGDSSVHHRLRRARRRQWGAHPVTRSLGEDMVRRAPPDGFALTVSGASESFATLSAEALRVRFRGESLNRSEDEAVETSESGSPPAQLPARAAASPPPEHGHVPHGKVRRLPVLGRHRQHSRALGRGVASSSNPHWTESAASTQQSRRNGTFSHAVTGAAGV